MQDADFLALVNHRLSLFLSQLRHTCLDAFLLYQSYAMSSGFMTKLIHSIFTTDKKRLRKHNSGTRNLPSNVDIASLDCSGMWYCPQSNNYRPIWVGVARSNVLHRVRGKMWRRMCSYSRLRTQRITHLTAYNFPPSSSRCSIPLLVMSSSFLALHSLTYEQDVKPLRQRLSYLPLLDHERFAPCASYHQIDVQVTQFSK